MRCPVCDKTLTKTEEILSQIEEVYYCHHCWARISDRATREATREKEEAERKVREQKVPVAS
jgi:hypothetical protein